MKVRDEFIVQLENWLHEIKNIEDQTLQLNDSQKQSKHHRQTEQRTQLKRDDSILKQCNNDTEKHNWSNLKVKSEWK